MTTFLFFEDPFSEQELQAKVKRLLLKKIVLKKKSFFIRLFQNCSLIALIYSSSD